MSTLIKRILSKRESVDFKRERDRMLEMYYLKFGPELEELSEPDWREVPDMHGITIGSDMFGRAILVEDERGTRRNAGYYKIPVTMDYTKYGRPTKSNGTGIFETIYKAIQDEIMYGKTADTGYRSSHYEEGHVPGQVHFVDSHGVDHGMVKDGASIERAESDRAKLNAYNYQCWIDQTEEETAALAKPGLKFIFAVTREMCDRITGMDRAEARTFIMDEAFNELTELLKDEFDTSFVLPRKISRAVLSRFKKKLWAQYKSQYSNRYEDCYNKVAKIINDALAEHPHNPDVAVEIAMYRAEKEMESVEFWTARKHMANGEVEVLPWRFMNALKKVAISKMSA